MSKINISELFIYRHRYFFGYCLIAISLLAVLIFAGLYSPGGITNLEEQSVITSNGIDAMHPSTFAIENLPYHLLQKASLALFGVSILSIKLPSILLAFLSAIGIVLLLRRWFKPGIGVLASLIAISTGQFIFFAQDGTPGIIYIFWAVWLLLLASLIIRREKYKIAYIIAFYIAAALSLYTPLSIYALTALVCAIIFHPHLRYLIRKLPKYKIIIGIAIATLLISPLIVSIIISPSLILNLLGIPNQWPNIWSNLGLLGTQYLGFASSKGSIMTTPFFELGSMMIVAFGLYNVIKDRYSSKNYVIIFWSLCIIPVIIMNPNFTSVSFVPILLLLSSGLNALLSHWYELFPNNPYARIGGLIPIVILVAALVFSGADRYIYGYTYNPNTVPNFSKDLSILPKEYVNIVATENEMSFYFLLAKYNKNITVSLAPVEDEAWVTRNAHQNFAGYELKRIITTATTKDSDRFYVYKKLPN